MPHQHKQNVGRILVGQCDRCQPSSWTGFGLVGIVLVAFLNHAVYVLRYQQCLQLCWEQWWQFVVVDTRTHANGYDTDSSTWNYQLYFKVVFNYTLIEHKKNVTKSFLNFRRCSVCETSTRIIAIHSQTMSIPDCPGGWEEMWAGYSYFMVNVYEFDEFE